MKTFKLFQRLILMAAIIPAFFMTGCVKDEFDVPPINVPTFTLPDGATLISIMDLKSRHTVSGALDSINDNVYIKGVVIGNDESGNIYKTMMIQDASGGIELKLNKTSLYNDYKIGQRIYVKCQGLILGDYNNLIQLGTIYNGGIGQIAEVNIPLHLFKDSLPGNPPTPKIISSVADLTMDKVSTLVTFSGASFPDAGSTWVASGDSYTNRDMNISGAVITVRSSSYANFADDIIPSGTGNVTAIMGIFGSTYQGTLRSASELSGFSSFQNTVLLDELFNTNPGWATYSVTSSQNWTWDGTYKCMIMDNSTGDVASEDWMFSPALNLSGMDSAYFEFRTWSKYSDAGQSEPLSLFVSNNYVDGSNPSTATWTQVYGTLCPLTSTWTSSGKIDLTAFVGQTVRIAWRYRSSGNTNTTATKWEVDGVKVTAKHN